MFLFFFLRLSGSGCCRSIDRTTTTRWRWWRQNIIIWSPRSTFSHRKHTFPNREQEQNSDQVEQIDQENLKWNIGDRQTTDDHKTVLVSQRKLWVWRMDGTEIGDWPTGIFYYPLPRVWIGKDANHSLFSGHSHLDLAFWNLCCTCTRGTHILSFWSSSPSRRRGSKRRSSSGRTDQVSIPKRQRGTTNLINPTYRISKPSVSQSLPGLMFLI